MQKITPIRVEMLHHRTQVVSKIWSDLYLYTQTMAAYRQTNRSTELHESGISKKNNNNKKNQTFIVVVENIFCGFLRRQPVQKLWHNTTLSLSGASYVLKYIFGCHCQDGTMKQVFHGNCSVVSSTEQHPSLHWPPALEDRRTLMTELMMAFLQQKQAISMCQTMSSKKAGLVQRATCGKIEPKKGLVPIICGSICMCHYLVTEPLAKGQFF